MKQLLDQLADALRDTTSSLEGWMEIQAEEDARDYDDQALVKAKAALAAYELTATNPALSEGAIKDAVLGVLESTSDGTFEGRDNTESWSLELIPGVHGKDPVGELANNLTKALHAALTRTPEHVEVAQDAPDEEPERGMRP